MQYRPDAKDLLLAVQDFLMKEVLPKLEDEELLSYKTLVSWNMLGVIAREIDKEDEFLNEEFKSLTKVKLINDTIKLSELEFKALTRREKTSMFLLWNKTFSRCLRETKESDTKSRTWSHIKLHLKNNLNIASPRFQT